MVSEKECLQETAARYWPEEDLKAEKNCQPKDAFVRLFNYSGIFV